MVAVVLVFIMNNMTANTENPYLGLARPVLQLTHEEAQKIIDRHRPHQLIASIELAQDRRTGYDYYICGRSHSISLTRSTDTQLTRRPMRSPFWHPSPSLPPTQLS